MLEPKDLEAIGQLMTTAINTQVPPIVQESEKRLRFELCEFINDNVLPQFTEVHSEIDELRDEIRGGFRRVDVKFDTLVDCLADNKTLTRREAAQVSAYRVVR